MNRSVLTWEIICVFNKETCIFIVKQKHTQPVIITKYTSSGWYKTCNVYSENSMEKESSIRWWFGPGELKSLSYRCFVWRLSCLFKLRWVFCAGFRVDMRDNCRSPKFTNMRTAISGTLRGTLQQTICYWFVYEYKIPELVWLWGQRSNSRAFGVFS